MLAQIPKAALARSPTLRAAYATIASIERPDRQLKQAFGKSPFMPDAAECRIAIVGTPRSGNTWLRRMLAEACAAAEYAAHRPSDLQWERLPARCVLQLHWHRDAKFASLLQSYRFKLVILSRHPLDVLLSILHFAPHEPDTARWLDGAGGSESAIMGALPASEAFAAYATGPRARALLGVSAGWWHAPDCHRIRYEDLVQEPHREIGRLCAEIGEPVSVADVARAVERNVFSALRSTSRNQHFWRGQPDGWREFLTPALACRIARANRQSFELLGYRCDPVEGLDESLANANWRRLL